MDSDFLIDTNILIYYFADLIPEGQILKINNIFINSFNISPITKIEFLGWKPHTEDSYKKAEQFLMQAKIISLRSSIIDKCIEIKRLYSIKLPDAVIAATAIVHDFKLVTRNVKDFESISEIQLFNPFE
jgi:toxin FitB